MSGTLPLQELNDEHRSLATDVRQIEAAARAHLHTGLTIASHTGLAVPAEEQLAVLDAEGVDRSAWISLDGIAPENVERYAERLAYLKAEDVLDRVLLSHDAGWYHVGEPGGGTFRPFDTLSTELLPALEAAGLTDDELDRLTVVNPAEAFAVRVRASTP